MQNASHRVKYTSSNVLQLSSSLEEAEIIKSFNNLQSIHSIFSFFEDKFTYLKFFSDVRIPYPIHLEILVQTLRYWVKDPPLFHLLRLFLYEYCNWNSLITQKKLILTFSKSNPRFFLFLYNFYVCEHESIFLFLRKKSSFLRLNSFSVLFERIYFYTKIEHLVEVFSNNFSSTLLFFKDPLIHYVRYQGKSILASKNTPFFMNKWRYYLIYFWQCYFHIWSQPRMIHINELFENSFHIFWGGYLSNVRLNFSVVRSQMLENLFLIEIVMKKLDTIVPIIPLIRSLAKAKFCNILGHPISKPVWADSSNFDIIDRYLRICRNLSHYYNGSSKKSLYRIKYIIRLSCIKTLARKHKRTLRAFLKRLDSEELLKEFFTEEEEILSLIFPRSSSTLRRLYRSRIWYLDILFSNDPINVN
ncbi:maturase K [Arachis hypogaea]|uniref:Maturase K n=2 Tax=Arachis hypogaea TaxID=3818 RepID=A0A445AH00_ARAHY|nr:hypothetical protein Ahy_B02g059673 isoform B [Arachis hypogaea]